MRFGLSDEIVADLQKVIAATPGVVRALVFGSRGRGNFKHSSDVDLAIEAPTMPAREFDVLCARLLAVPMVFRLDIVRMEEVSNADLRLCIERDGASLLT